MTFEIGFLFAVLAAMVILFLTEWLPIDLTAFLGLVVLIFAGYVTPADAFQGFASPAVITMLSIFVISAALLETGVADALGSRIHRWVGSKEITLSVTVMLAAGVLSAFMNNIAATAVLMPAVAALGRRAGLPPSRLFMPLAFGAILGGTTTLVGTPPNILAGAMLEERGMEPFALFDFAPVGLSLLAVGILYMITIGRKLLPGEQTAAGIEVGEDGGPNLSDIYQLQESLFRITVPPSSRLDGMTLGESRLGNSLGIQIVSILRDGKDEIAPSRETALQANDELLLQGGLAELRELLAIQGIDVEDPITRDLRPPPGISGLRARLPEGSWFVGRSLREVGFRERFGVIVVAIERGEQVFRDSLAQVDLELGDVIVGLGTERRVEALVRMPDVEVLETGVQSVRRTPGQPFFVLRLPEASPLVGSSVGRSRMGELMGLTVVAIMRGQAPPIPALPEEVLEAGDRLLVSGERPRVTGLLALGDVRLEDGVPDTRLQTGEIGVLEATVAPRSTVNGRTLSDIGFRERHGLHVLGLWREGRPIREGLSDLKLAVGDALLLRGPHDRLALFSSDRDFVVLSDAVGQRRSGKAVWAIGGLFLMIGLVIFGIQPIQVAAFTAASLVLLSGALTMNEAYLAIEWRAIFLVAAVLPVGSAMESSGAASLMASGIIDGAGPMGPTVVLAALVVLSSALSQGLDGAPAVVLLTPVVLEAAEGLGVSPYPLMMGVSVAASAAFMTPFSHKANLLVMGSGGYRSVDYLRVGTPLTIVLLALMVLIIPVFFPF